MVQIRQTNVLTDKEHHQLFGRGEDIFETASPHAYIVQFYRAFAGRCVTTDLTLSDPSALARRPKLTSDLPSFVAEQDVIYVGGGNTANLLALWRVHGLDVLLRQAWLAGAVLCGVSAGMICWSCGGVTDSYGGLDSLDAGLGLVQATACPPDSWVREQRTPTLAANTGCANLLRVNTSRLAPPVVQVVAMCRKLIARRT